MLKKILSIILVSAIVITSQETGVLASTTGIFGTYTDQQMSSPNVCELYFPNLTSGTTETSVSIYGEYSSWCGSSSVKISAKRPGNSSDWDCYFYNWDSKFTAGNCYETSNSNIVTATNAPYNNQIGSTGSMSLHGGSSYGKCDVTVSYGYRSSDYTTRVGGLNSLTIHVTHYCFADNIILPEEHVYMEKGDKENYAATVSTPNDEYYASQYFGYKSSNTNVATVDENGICDLLEIYPANYYYDKKLDTLVLRRNEEINVWKDLE